MADALAEDCLAFGIDPALLNRAAPDEDGIWPEHVAALEAFLSVRDQWRVAAGQNGVVFLGLDYTAVRAGFDLAGITLTPAQWADVQMIEAGAVAAMNEV